MNPLDLTGPYFLVFYAVYGAVICWGLSLLKLTTEPQMPTRAVPRDPLTIAYLRGGAREALRLSAMTLLERGVLALAPHDTLRADGSQPLPADASLVDRAVRDHFGNGASARSLLTDGSLALRVQAHAVPTLEDAGLVPGDVLRDVRARRVIGAVVLLGVLAAAKITVALWRGHSNFLLLVVEAIVFGSIAYNMTIRHRTPAGERALKYLMHTFGPVRDRAAAMAHPPFGDLAIVAAVFGLAALPDVLSANVAALQLHPGSGGSDDGCGGGCGGCGCGGCGGCG